MVAVLVVLVLVAVVMVVEEVYQEVLVWMEVEEVLAPMWEVVPIAAPLTLGIHNW